MLLATRSHVGTVQERSPELWDWRTSSVGDQLDSVSSLALRHTETMLHILSQGGSPHLHFQPIVKRDYSTEFRSMKRNKDLSALDLGSDSHSWNLMFSLP